MKAVRGGGGDGSGGSGRRKFGGQPPTNRSKEIDEDLILFREMHKREKDRIVSLLQPVSDEFEPTGGNNALYRMRSGKKGPADREKNDYDWLKTPPATPLFPSLEMEANATDMVVQRELPIIQTLSRFAGNSEAAKTTSINSERSKSPSPKVKIPLRSITPTRKLNINASNDQKKNSKSAPTLNQKTNQLATSNLIKNSVLVQNESNMNFLASNLSKSIGLDSVKTKSTSGKVSPQARSTINTSHILGFSDETPPNLKTDRSESTLRGRPDRSSSALKGRPGSTLKGQSDQSNSILKSDRSSSVLKGQSDRSRSVLKDQSYRSSAVLKGQSDRSGSTLKGRSNQPDSTLKARSDRPGSTLRGRPEMQTQATKNGNESTTRAIRRQSCSPSRKMTLKKESTNSSEENVTTPKGKYQSGNGGQVFGSRMVDKFLNARKTSAEERDTKPKLYGSLNESSGFGRIMAKSSLDINVKNVQDNKRESTNFRQNGIGRRSSDTSSSSSSKANTGISRQL